MKFITPKLSPIQFDGNFILLSPFLLDKKKKMIYFYNENKNSKN